MLIEEMLEIITEEIAKNEEYQRLLDIDWSQKLLTIRTNKNGFIDENGIYIRYVKIMVDPYIGISLDYALDTSRCYYCSSMPLTRDVSVRDSYFLNWGYDSIILLQDIADFFFQLQCLEHCKTYEKFKTSTEGEGYGFTDFVPCAFTG